jgi:hypothetical protein
LIERERGLRPSAAQLDRPVTKVEQLDTTGPLIGSLGADAPAAKPTSDAAIVFEITLE